MVASISIPPKHSFSNRNLLECPSWRGTRGSSCRTFQSLQDSCSLEITLILNCPCLINFCCTSIFPKTSIAFLISEPPQITDRPPSCIRCYFPYMFNDKEECISSGHRKSWIQSEHADFLSQHIFKGALWNCLNRAHTGVLFVWNLAFCKQLAHGVFWTPVAPWVSIHMG